VFGAGVAVFGRSLPQKLRADALAVQGMIGAAFLAFILLTSNPFERPVAGAVRGQDLNPILQDPGWRSIRRCSISAMSASRSSSPSPPRR